MRVSGLDFVLSKGLGNVALGRLVGIVVSTLCDSVALAISYCSCSNMSVMNRCCSTLTGFDHELFANGLIIPRLYRYIQRS